MICTPLGIIMSLADTIPPTAPVLVSATDTIPGILLIWTHGTDIVGITNYEINRRLDGGAWGIVALIGYTTLYTDVTATAGFNEYRLRSKDAAGNFSGFSNIKSVTI